MAIDLRKAVSDAGYVGVGVAVLAFQQAQVRRRELQQRVGDTGGCLNTRALEGKARLETLQQTVGATTQSLRDRIEHGGREAFDRAQELSVELKDRIEPVVGQVVEQVGMRVQTVITRAA
jgi:hypothetical protein